MYMRIKSIGKRSLQSWIWQISSVVIVALLLTAENVGHNEALLSFLEQDIHIFITSRLDSCNWLYVLSSVLYLQFVKNAAPIPSRLLSIYLNQVTLDIPRSKNRGEDTQWLLKTSGIERQPI